MKKILLLLVFLNCLFHANATIRRVNNNTGINNNTTAGNFYTTLSGLGIIVMITVFAFISILILEFKTFVYNNIPPIKTAARSNSRRCFYR